jgi:hypothetical protein
MQIFIKGISHRTHTTITTLNDVEETDSTRILYVLINNMFGISQKDYYLQFNKILSFSDDKSLSDCGIVKESTVHLHFRMGDACNIK